MKHKIARKIIVLSVSLALVFSAVIPAPAQAAGIYTHSIFVELAIYQLTAYGGYSELVDILNSYPAVVNYGAMFPDITYLDIDNDWAEMLHDTNVVSSNYEKYLEFLADKGYEYNWDLQAGWYKEFLEDPAYEASIPWFRRALMGQILPAFRSNPRSAEDEKMIAFLFGLIAHQEADIPWHWNRKAWRGVEPTSIAVFGFNDYGLEMTAKYFHYGNSADFDYVNTVYNTILAASDAVGSRRPYCHVPCVASPDDPIRTGNFNASVFWLEPPVPPGLPWYWDDYNNFINDYVPGGIHDGGALVAGAWMEAWDFLSDYDFKYYVKPVAAGSGSCHNWGNACELRYALNHSLPGQEIFVVKGVHKPTTVAGNRAATFQLINDVAIYGGFAGGETSRDQRDPVANLTILSGDIDNNDSQTPIINDLSTVTGNTTNSYHVVTTGNGITKTAILDGFTITGGNANEGWWAGGGMANYGGSPTLSNVTFSGNSAGFDGGGMFNWYGSPTLINVTFSDNNANYGGGMLSFGGGSELTNVTFSGNSAVNQGGGMYNGSGGSPTLTNAILWGNTPDQIYNNGSTPVVTYSDIQLQAGSVYTGIGNINADPLFVDAAGGNLRLRPFSPAIDAGNNEAAGLIGVTTDLDGKPRFVDIPSVPDTGNGNPPIVDMGAYEATYLTVYLPLVKR